MSDGIDQILAGIDTLEIARIKGGLWKMALTMVLAQTGTRGVDWTPEKVFADIEAAVLTVQHGKDTKDVVVGIEGHIQDALAEFRAEARDLLT